MKYTNWDKKGPIAKKLIEQLDLFQKTKGQAGIDPNTTKPANIRTDIRDKHSFLQTLNPSYFPKHFRDLVDDWRVNKDLKGARKGE